MADVGAAVDVVAAGAVEVVAKAVIIVANPVIYRVIVTSRVTNEAMIAVVIGVADAIVTVDGIVMGVAAAVAEYDAINAVVQDILLGRKFL